MSGPVVVVTDRTVYLPEGLAREVRVVPWHVVLGSRTCQLSSAGRTTPPGGSRGWRR